MRKLLKRISTRNKLILAVATLSIMSVALVLVFTTPWEGKETAGHSDAEVTPGPPVDHCPWTKPGSMKIDWDRIHAMSQYDFRLNSDSGLANIPVKGELRVEIDPADTQKIPETLKVYKIVPLVQSEDEFKQIAARFDLRGELKEGYICISDGKRYISYDAEEDVLTYYDRERIKHSREVPNVPSKEECMEIAMEIARETGLLPPGAEVIATNSEQGTTSAETGNRMHVMMRGIVIGISIAGYDVRGLGMELRMELGAKGELCSLRNRLRKFEYYGTYPVKPIDQALQEARMGKDTLNLEPDRENPTVTDFDIHYYSDNSYRKNSLLLPVYAFMGSDCCIYVPAVNQN